MKYLAFLFFILLFITVFNMPEGLAVGFHYDLPIVTNETHRSLEKYDVLDEWGNKLGKITNGLLFDNNEEVVAKVWDVETNMPDADVVGTIAHGQVLTLYKQNQKVPYEEIRSEMKELALMNKVFQCKETIARQIQIH